MKNNIYGYLFIIFFILIMTFAIYKVKYSDEKTETSKIEKSSNNISITEKGKKITLGISEFDTINPIITKNKKVQDVTKIIYESLVNITEDGRVESSLAKEWKATDNITYIVKLKSGIKWTDGTYFSSNDVKYTIDRLKESDNSVYAQNVKKVREVDIIDNTTLRIILSEPMPFYEYYLNFPILCSSYYGQDDFWNTDKNQAPITTGRFKISEVTSNTIVLTKNKDWWNIEDDNSVIEEITINLYSSVAELYNAFKLGSIDLISTANENYKEYIGTIGYDTTEIEGRNYLFLALNTQSTILSDVDVRRAIKSALNKDEIVSSVYNNSYSVANFPLPTNSYMVNDSNENSFDISKIDSLLVNKNWSLKNSQWQKVIDYKTVKLQLSLVVKNDEKRVGVANYIKESLAKQGIGINIIVVSDADYRKYLENKQYDIILSEVTQSIAPDLSTYFGTNNLANFSNNEVNEIMSYIANIEDENELKTKFQRLYEIYNEEVPYVGIARNKIYVVTNSYLTGEINSKWYNLFFGIKDWYTN